MFASLSSMKHLSEPKPLPKIPTSAPSIVRPPNILIQVPEAARTALVCALAAPLARTGAAPAVLQMHH